MSDRQILHHFEIYLVSVAAANWNDSVWFVNSLFFSCVLIAVLD